MSGHECTGCGSPLGAGERFVKHWRTLLRPVPVGGPRFSGLVLTDVVCAACAEVRESRDHAIGLAIAAHERWVREQLAKGRTHEEIYGGAVSYQPMR